jgi:cytochrome P450
MIDAAQRDADEHEAQTSKVGKVADLENTSKAPHAHTLYHSLLASTMPDSEKKPTRMAHEGFEILLAGSDTTARTMGIAAYHVIANPTIAKQLRDELKTVMPGAHSNPTLKDLEGLPYLVSFRSVTRSYNASQLWDD